LFSEPRDGVGNQDEDTPAEHGDIVGNMNQPEQPTYGSNYVQKKVLSSLSFGYG
jgi:hypothetical protein